MAKASGDKVTGATVNGNGSLIIRAAVGADTLRYGGGSAAYTRAIQWLADIVAKYLVKIVALASFHSLTRFRRNALVTTETELSAMAAPAKTGDSSKPKAG